MATVDKFFADNLVRNNGFYDGDDDQSMGDNPRTVTITEYDNAFGGTSYGITSEWEDNKYTPSPFVRRPRLYWQYNPNYENLPNK
jgi:hypothetical protein